MADETAIAACANFDRKYLQGFLIFGGAFAGAIAFGLAVLTVIATALSQFLTAH